MNVIAQYPGKENLMYEVSRTIWASCSRNIDVFAGKRAVYTDEYIAARLAEIDTAEAMPNDAQRTAAYELIRINMVTQCDTGCDAFQMLKLYIRHAFRKDEFDAQYKNAGGDMYDESAHYNWISAKSMFLQGSKFISENVVALKANQNMPNGFEAEYNEQMNAFNTLFDSYYAQRQSASEGAASKVDMNNTVYNQCIAMAMDGWQFFKNSTIQSEFSYEAVSSMLSPAGASTASITVVDSVTEKPIVATVTDQSSERMITTDKQTGKAEFGNLAADTTSFAVEAQGYGTQIIPMTLKTGTTSRELVKLVKVVTTVDSQMRMPVPENGMTEIDSVGSGQSSVSSASREAVG